MGPGREDERSELLRAAAGDIAALAERTGETIVLAVMDGKEAACIAESAGGGRIGRRVPLLDSAIGEVLAASQDTAFRSSLPGSDERQPAARLDLVRARGYAIGAGDFVKENSVVAAPILNGSGNAIAALAIEGPRLSRDRLHDLALPLIEATRSISLHFGGAPRPTSKAPRPSLPVSPFVRLVADTKNLIGECPLYDAANDRLFWVDMYDPAVFRLDRKSGTLSSFSQDEMVLALAPAPEGMLVAAQSGLWLAEPDTFRRIRHLGHPEAGNPANRFNDGKCDSRGRFWVNTLDLDFRAGAGALYRLDPDGSFATADTGFTLPNGMGWSPDDRTMYLVETRERAIHAYDFSAASGRISNRRVLVRIPDDAGGAPDGMAVDRDGNLWVALFDGWRVSQYSPAGRLLREIALPVPRPTSCAVGGSDGRTLFVTSARIRVGEAMLREAPYSGAVFEIAL